MQTFSAKTYTFEEYLLFEGEPGIRYELVDGRIEEMTTASGRHTAICEFLSASFQRCISAQGAAWVAKSVVGVRTGEASSRIPDVVVCTRELWERLSVRGGAGVFGTGETPLLTVEVVSEDWQRDYVRKRKEYAHIEIPEYWIVDPNKQRVWILMEPRNEEHYEVTEYLPGQVIASQLFPELSLSVEEILSPPLVEDLIAREQEQLKQAQQRAEQERQRAEQERQRAEQERQGREAAEKRLNRMTEFLRSQNIDPDNL